MTQNPKGFRIFENSNHFDAQDRTNPNVERLHVLRRPHPSKPRVLIYPTNKVFHREEGVRGGSLEEVRAILGETGRPRLETWLSTLDRERDLDPKSTLEDTQKVLQERGLLDYILKPNEEPAYLKENKKNRNEDYSWRPEAGPIDFIEMIDRARECPSVSLFYPIWWDGKTERAVAKELEDVPRHREAEDWVSLTTKSTQESHYLPRGATARADRAVCREDLRRILQLSDTEINRFFPDLREEISSNYFTLEIATANSLDSPTQKTSGERIGVYDARIKTALASVVLKTFRDGDNGTTSFRRSLPSREMEFESIWSCFLFEDGTLSATGGGGENRVPLELFKKK